MNSFKRILIGLMIFHLMFQPSNQFSLRPKHFKVERAASCNPVDLKHSGKLERFDLSQPTKYSFHLDADLRVIKDVTNPIQFHMKYSKCALDNLGSICDGQETIKINNVCEQLSDKNAVWAPLMKIIKPKLSCPIKKGVYVIRNGTFDLSMMSRLPIDGYRYVSTISFYELVKNATEPLQIMCLDSDVSITLLSNGRPRQKGRQ